MTNDLCKFFMGTSHRARIGTKRFSTSRLINFLKGRDKSGFGAANMNFYVVGAVIIKTILDQLDWQFESIDTIQLEEVHTRLLSTHDLERIYFEGWLYKTLPSTSEWVISYQGSQDVTASALAELISNSLVALRSKLMRMELLQRRFTDVVNAARLCCALQHGLVEDVANETLLAFATSSAAVNDMAGWSCIVTDLFGNNFRNLKQDVTATRVDDVSLLLSFADELVASVRSHNLVEMMSPGDYIKHIHIKHYETESNLRYHTTIYGNILGCRPSSHFIEATLGSNIYGVTVVKDNAAFNKEVADIYTESANAAIEMLSEVDQLTTLHNLSTFERPGNVADAGCHGFTAINVHSGDLLLAALIQNELLVRYRRNTSAKTGVVFLDVLATYFILRNTSISAANPFPIFDEAVYTQSSIIALCMGQSTIGTGIAPLMRADVELDSAPYVISSVRDMIKLNRITEIPDSIQHTFSIRDVQDKDVMIPITLDVSRYITYSAFDKTYALIARELDIYRSLSEYALAMAAKGAVFTQDDTQLAYDIERMHRNFLVSYVGATRKSKFVRSITSALRFDAAVAASGTFGSLSNAIHNLALNNHCVLFAAGIPAMIALNDASANQQSALNDAYKNNRLFRDYMLSIIKDL